MAGRRVVNGVGVFYTLVFQYDTLKLLDHRTQHVSTFFYLLQGFFSI